jgi:hypothetical protein
VGDGVGGTVGARKVLIGVKSKFSTEHFCVETQSFACCAGKAEIKLGCCHAHILLMPRRVGLKLEGCEGASGSSPWGVREGWVEGRGV